MTDTYTCANCNGTFEKGWTDAEALAEAQGLWGDDLGDDPAVVCEDCFQAMTGDPDPYEPAVLPVAGSTTGATVGELTDMIHLEAGEQVNNVAAGIGHHHATGHLGGGAGEDYDCNECDFWIADGVVRTGGPILVRAKGRDR